MSERKRKTFSADFKAKVALEAIHETVRQVRWRKTKDGLLRVY